MATQLGMAIAMLALFALCFAFLSFCERQIERGSEP